MRHIAHIAAVALKYFFDIDHHIFTNVYTIILLLAATLKIAPMLIANQFYDGAQTVKQDLRDIRYIAIAYKERWDNSDLHETLANIRLFDRYSRS